ncbi:hypothetical protein BKA62DRAFT_639662 [Auriculariales sp. MPI-PUGE-AT-0066]|nr:hypothetical protein BKA62DRAFT_639662 [Auriculariales sp. MPI-PUGE-AT-0066]
MKFGKEILANQVPGWSTKYLDYKALKKIVSSLTKRRLPLTSSTLPGPAPDYNGLGVTSEVHTFAQPTLWESSATDPVEPPLPAYLSSNDDRGPVFQQHKAAFFSRLEEELKKINGFYLQREAELRLRLENLLRKRQAAAQRLSESSQEDNPLDYVEWRAIEEGFRVLEHDLGKVQQFIDMNATGFRKILKKWDKRSKSTTKELYLSRQVEVTPCFNRQLISEMTDTVASCLLDVASSAIVSSRLPEGTLPDRTGPSGNAYKELEDGFGKAIATRDVVMLRTLLSQAAELALQATVRTHVARILWRGIIVAPPALADIMIASEDISFDFNFVDDINGRTCLHEAAIAGELRLLNICLARGVPINQVDAYGRNALHYASINGNAPICGALLEFNGSHGRVDPCAFDLENHTPLVYACISGSHDSVSVLLEDSRVAMELPATTADLNPLSLASRMGHTSVVRVLLSHGAPNRPNRNGEFPLHLAAHHGHADICDLLCQHEMCDRADKYNEWTPLFHAAANGHSNCIRVLIQHGCNRAALDENGRSALYHAAWNGHVDCVSLLLSGHDPVAAQPTSQISPFINISPAQAEAASDSGDLDMIPSLLLPPPIMPLRTYGHNFLHHNHLIVVGLGHPFTGTTREPLQLRLKSERFVKSSGVQSTTQPPALRLVVSSLPETLMTPFEVLLPVGSQTTTLSFQAPTTDQIALQFSLYPSFGTKMLGKAVVHPALVANSKSMTSCTLPLLDHRLNVIGEIYADLFTISPLHGPTLSLNGGIIDTYWKSNVPQPPPAQPTRPAPRGLSSTQTSPSNVSASATDSPRPPTVSSLVGDFVHAIVQVTRDGVPVVFHAQTLPDAHFSLGIRDVVFAEVHSLATRLGKDGWKCGQMATASGWQAVISDRLITLKTLLEVLPASIGLLVELAFTDPRERQQSINSGVDAVLLTLYGCTTSTSVSEGIRRRKIAFVSRSPDICAAVNWKQPNYPVFFASACGSQQQTSWLEHPIPEDRRCRSLGAAVEFASSNNLLGIIIPSTLIAEVPALAAGVKQHGLMLATYGSQEALQFADHADAILSNGVFSVPDNSRRVAS